jgi:cytidine deaminase
VVAVSLVSPCGSCRELIWDYDRNARVIVPSANGPVVAAISELLPNKYSRERTL